MANNVTRLSPSTYQQYYPRYVDAGFQPRPIEPGTKGCKVTGWQEDVPTVSEPRGRDCGIGLRLGTRFEDGTYLVALDIDREEFVRLAHALVPSPCGRFGSKGIALFARTQEEAGKFNLKLANGGGKAGEFLGAASFCVIPPTIHPDTKAPYEWRGTSLLELADGWRELPLIDPEFIEVVFASEHLPQIMGGVQTHDDMRDLIAELANVCDDFDLIESVVRAAFPEDYRGNSLKEIPGLIRTTREKFSSGRWARKIDAFDLSEEAIGADFANRHSDDLRFISKWGRWLMWDGARWVEDDKRQAFSLAGALSREYAQRASKSLKRTIASAKTRAAILAIAQTDERIAASIDQWDLDPWLLNTPGGTVDLTTGELRPHRRSDHITKMTAVTPDPERETPAFMAFLNRVTDGNKELQAYLQRVCGYALTGVTREHALFFWFGTGNNGKSTLINIMGGAMGDYHAVVPMDALLTSFSERHPADLAKLAGARLATAVELGEGRYWDEPKIKMLTGGDKISARFMRQDFFDFTPQFKLLIAGNHKPGLRSVNVAIRRRMQLGPFTVTIPDDEIDKQLDEKLKAEWPGILAWMVEGCLEWQRIGLAPPKCVTEATDDYLEAQDVVADFLAECCADEKAATSKSSALFSTWSGFCEARGEKPGNQRRFKAVLEEKGYAWKRTNEGVFFEGLRLKTQNGDAQTGDQAEPSWKKY